MSRRHITLCIFLLVFSAARADTATVEFSGSGGPFLAERVLDGLSQPAAIEFLPDGSMLIAQRNTATLSRVDIATGSRTDVSGMPAILAYSDSGLHDIELHPEFANNGWIYISYSEGQEIHSTVVLDRIRLEGAAVAGRERIFTADAYAESSYHYGGRIQFRDGYVFMTIGDRQHPERAQDRSNHTGTIVRLHDDGRVPGDNPFVEQGGEADRARPEIWSYGHRNPQGLCVDPETGELWAHEHGPRGGDELNRIVGGANYGWPVISYGFEYEGGPIGKGIVREDGMEQPVWVYVPSIAPSDLVIYRGSAFPEWQGSLLLGAMGLTHLNRLVLRDGAVVLEERLARDLLGRIRALAVDSDGLIYLGNDAGEIWRLRPR